MKVPAQMAKTGSSRRRQKIRPHAKLMYRAHKQVSSESPCHSRVYFFILNHFLSCRLFLLGWNGRTFKPLDSLCQRKFCWLSLALKLLACPRATGSGRSLCRTWPMPSRCSNRKLAQGLQLDALMGFNECFLPTLFSNKYILNLSCFAWSPNKYLNQFYSTSLVFNWWLHLVSIKKISG